ncbi:hypothetical protein [Microbacterium sp. BR1]|uniref:hypothetical protein n=1 Tax=Microbacterium sp. BR1 TaxID=1070896 RepID=UPI0012FE65A5|nr:hypothetical protein [Microbacterium sp. BR1]
MDKVRRAQRAHATLEILAARDDPSEFMPLVDLWPLVAARVPLTEHESEMNGRQPRGEIDWRWGSSYLVSAGWLRKHSDGSGKWAITPEGQQAMEEYQGEELLAEAMRRYAAGRAALLAQIEEGLPTKWISAAQAERKLLTAADVIVERGLKQGTSAFAETREAWSPANIIRLHERWSSAERFEGGFIDNLGRQLDGATDDEKLLMAEVVALQILPIASAMGHAKKTEKVQAILDLMEHKVQIPSVFDEAFGGGAFNPGSGMMSRINHAVTIILNVLRAWIDLADPETVLEDPHAWRELVMSVEGDAFPTQRYALLYLVHPGYFGPIVSADHREAIRKAFIGEIGGEFSTDADDDLLRIVIALQVKDRKPVNFYDKKSALWRRWNPEEDAPPADPDPIDPVEDLAEPVLDPRGFSPEGIDTRGLSDELHLDEQWVGDVVRALHRRGQIRA